MRDFLQEQWLKFVAWVNSHGGPTKVGAVAIILAGAAYLKVPSFHDLCLRVWMVVPTWFKTLCIVTWNLYSWLRNPATKKLTDALLGPGDTLKMQKPVLDPSTGVLSADSATVKKAPETPPSV